MKKDRIPGCSTTVEASNAKEYAETFKNTLESKGYTVSDIAEYQGRMAYNWIRVDYSADGVDYCENIFVSMDSNGDIWMLDLYGTIENVEAQDDNLDNMLWSLHEHWDY